MQTVVAKSDSQTTKIDNIENDENARFIKKNSIAKIAENNNFDCQQRTLVSEFGSVTLLNSPKEFAISQQIVTDETAIDEKSFAHKCTVMIRPFKGIILIILTSICFCLSTILVKMATVLSGTDSSTLNYIVWLVLMFIIAKFKNVSLTGPFKTGVRKLLIMRGLFGVLCLVFIYTALKLMDPSDVFSILQSSFIITAILARIFLKETFTICHIVVSVSTVAGIVLISKPTFLFSNRLSSMIVSTDDNYSHSGLYENNTNSNQTMLDITNSYEKYIGLGFTLLASFKLAIVQITLKKLVTHKIHFSLATIYSSYFGIPICFLVSLVLYFTGFSHQDIKNELPKMPASIVYCLISGVLATFGQVFLIMSFKYYDATIVGILRTIEVLFSFIFQYILLDIKADLANVLGSLLIVSSAAIIFFINFMQNRWTNQDNLDPTRNPKKEPNKFLRFLLYKF
jgi:drug/metabolite transporter (DMT)-like permease